MNGRSAVFDFTMHFAPQVRARGHLHLDPGSLSRSRAWVRANEILDDLRYRTGSLRGLDEDDAPVVSRKGWLAANGVLALADVARGAVSVLEEDVLRLD